MASSAKREQADRIGRAITQLIRLGGLVLVFVDAFTGPPGIDPSTWAGAAFMMAGAQGLDAARDAFGGKS